MKYYTSTTEFNCGIDLHAHQMYVCLMDRPGKILVHTNIKNNDFAYFLKRIEPYRHDSRALEKDCRHAIGTRAMRAISLRSGFQSPNTRRIGDQWAEKQNARDVQKENALTIRRARSTPDSIGAPSLRSVGQCYLCSLGSNVILNRKQM